MPSVPAPEGTEYVPINVKDIGKLTWKAATVKMAREFKKCTFTKGKGNNDSQNGVTRQGRWCECSGDVAYSRSDSINPLHKSDIETITVTALCDCYSSLLEPGCSDEGDLSDQMCLPRSDWDYVSYDVIDGEKKIREADKIYGCFGRKDCKAVMREYGDRDFNIHESETNDCHKHTKDTRLWNSIVSNLVYVSVLGT